MEMVEECAKDAEMETSLCCLKLEPRVTSIITIERKMTKVGKT